MPHCGERFAEKAMRRPRVSPVRQHKVDQPAVLVDSPEQVLPIAGNHDVGLVHAPGGGTVALIPTNPLLEFRGVANATREAARVIERIDQPAAGDGSGGRDGVAERLVVPGMSGNSGRGKGPQFRTNAEGGKGQEIGRPINSGKRSETADGVACKSEG